MIRILSYVVSGVFLIAGINCEAAAPTRNNQPIESYSQASQDRFVHLMLYEILNEGIAKLA